MRIRSLSWDSTIWLLVVVQWTIAVPGIFYARQDGSSISTSLPPSPTQDPSSNTPSATAAPTSDASVGVHPTSNGTDITTSSSGSQTASQSSTSPTSVSVTSTRQPAAPTQILNNGTANGTLADQQKLPLQPVITPALGITGVILIVTGAVYALIGIKNRWLQIFLSVSYLISLSTAVLIIYVMSPPVSRGIQGAYFIAIFMTGVIFGAGALIFREVTEGLGCLLGGFCLAMWLLTLKAGGLLTSTGAIVIFILAFALSSWALSFSHYTRPHGLIGATSFAGATAVVLGVDCFTRAGLKEFWLYIWNLNDNLFPLNTTTYPVNRGVRVETAVIVLICILGVVSQLKLWRKIKDRREQRDAIRTADERRQDAIDQVMARHLDQRTRRERVRWEKVYSNRDRANRDTLVDSGVGIEGSVSKGSIKGQGSEDEKGTTESMEMRDLNGQPTDPTSISGSKRLSTATNPTMQEPADRRVEATPRLNGLTEASTNRWNERPISHVSKAPPARVTSSPIPEITPLPFIIPDSMSNHDDAASTVSSDLPEPVPSKSPNRLSDHSVFRRLSGKQKKKTEVSQSEEALITLTFNHSRASSVAATLNDDLGDLDRDLPRLSIVPAIDSDFIDSLEHELDTRDPPSSAGQDPQETYPPTPPALDVNEDFDPEEFSRPPTALDRRTDTPPSRKEQFGKGARIPEASESSSDMEGSTNEFRHNHKGEKALSIASVASSSESLTRDALDKMPSQLSNVVMTYRTNEWAKHISTADAPVNDNLTSTTNDDDQSTKLVESPTDILANLAYQRSPQIGDNVKSTLQMDSKPPLPHILSEMGIENTEPTLQILQSSQFSHHLVSNPPPAIVLPPPAAAPSQRPSLSSMRGLRSSSSPLLSQTLIPPIDENEEAHFVSPERLVQSPSMAPPAPIHRQNSLERSTLRSHSTPALVDPASSKSANHGNSLRRSISSTANTSRMTLPGQQRSATPDYQHRPWEFSPTRMASYDSHQPQRSKSTMEPSRRESLLASWRGSIRQDLAVNSVPREALEQRRADMLNEKHHHRLSKHREEANKVVQENAFDQVMRRGDMQALHREAMRKMQAKANKHLST